MPSMFYPRYDETAFEGSLANWRSIWRSTVSKVRQSTNRYMGCQEALLPGLLAAVLVLVRRVK